MKRILFLLCLIGVFASNVQIDAQVSRSAMIEDSDFKPGMKFMGGVGFGYSVPFFVEEGFISVEGSFSLGSFENRYKPSDFSSDPFDEIHLLTEDEFKKQESFVGFDFENVWEMEMEFSTG